MKELMMWVIDKVESDEINKDERNEIKMMLKKNERIEGSVMRKKKREKE